MKSILQTKLILLCLIVLLSLLPQYASALPAFPGAEGFGANTIGGRGGRVIKVTNLNDSGSGSFREAVEASGARIIVFEVSGIINLESRIDLLNPYVTIAGETSPGGILITGYKFLINTHEVIIRHMRFRVGSHQIPNGANAEELDSFVIWGERWGANEAYNIIIDHCSASWGVDETFSVTGGVTNTTIQWCIVSEGLRDAGHPDGTHSKGMFLSGKYVYPNSLSVHHNYIAHNTDRSPLIYSPSGVDTLVDYRNNISYNWHGGLAPAGEEVAHINWVHNYSKPGLDSHSWSYEVTHYAKDTITPEPILYVSGNMGPNRSSQDMPDWHVGWYYTQEDCSTDWRKDTPWDVPAVTTTVMAYPSVTDCILSGVGATAPFRDSVDVRVITDFNAGTGSIIDNIVYPDDFPEFSSLSSPLDTDNDGMPDSWEVSNGLNPSINDSAHDVDGDGYTNIEEYLHHLSASSITYNELCMGAIEPDLKPVIQSVEITTNE